VNFHRCKFDVFDVVGDEYSKFYINRVCRICGKTYHKDLRYGTENGWQEGPYSPDSYDIERKKVTFVKQETRRKYNLK